MGFLLVVSGQLPDTSIHQGALTASGPSINLVQGLLNLKTPLHLGEHSLVLHLLHRNVRQNINRFLSNRNASNLDTIVYASAHRLLSRIENVQHSSCSHWLSDKPFSNRRRSKRGAIDIGGSLLKAVFGVATSGDVNKLKSSLKSNIKKNTVEIKLVHRAVITIDKILREIRANTISFENHLTRFLETTSFSEVLEASSDQLQDIKDACLELNYIYSGVHRLGIYLFNFTEISKYVEQTKDVWGLLPITPLDVSNHGSFVDTLDINIVNDKNSSQLILSVPFVSRTSYDLYYVYPIPMFVVNDTTLQMKYSVNIEYPVILMSSDERYFSLQKESYLKDCTFNHNIPFICPNVIIQDLYNTKVVPCEIEILLKRNVTQCSYASHRSHEYSFLKVNEMTIISGYPGDELSLDCSSNNTQSKTILNSGILAVPSSCAIRSNYINYVPLQMSSIDVTYLPFQPTNLNFTIRQNISHLVSKLSLEKLEDQLNSNVTTEHVEVLYKYNHVQSGLIIIIVIMLICVIICFSAKRKVSFQPIEENLPLEQQATYKRTQGGVAFHVDN